jgi:serine/threonine protein kinase
MWRKVYIIDDTESWNLDPGEITMYKYYDLAFHEKNLIHRDIKPENFTISR